MCKLALKKQFTQKRKTPIDENEDDDDKNNLWKIIISVYVKAWWWWWWRCWRKAEQRDREKVILIDSLDTHLSSIFLDIWILRENWVASPKMKETHQRILQVLSSSAIGGVKCVFKYIIRLIYWRMKMGKHTKILLIFRKNKLFLLMRDAVCCLLVSSRSLSFRFIRST